MNTKQLLKQLLQLHQQENKLQQRVTKQFWLNQQVLAKTINNRLSQKEVLRLQDVENMTYNNNMELHFTQSLNRLNDFYSYLGKKGYKPKMQRWTQESLNFEFNQRHFYFDSKQKKVQKIGQQKFKPQGKVQPQWAFEINQQRKNLI